ncbi:MAG TPA: hypothetical protein VM509_06375, partial [Planctomycetota bacterium]|nr:hypothetical protein [Planctomycetota bacterium]
MMTSATWSFVRVARGSTQALLVVLVSLFTLCASSSPQGTRDKASPPLFLFAGSLKQAAARAAERNVPIVAIALLDKESDNESARTQLLASPEIAKLSASCVLFFSNLGVHPPREIVETQDGTKRTRVVCSAFGTATCREHQQHWDDIYAKFNEDGGLRCPQVLVLAPDATLEGSVSPGLKP